MKDLIYKLRVYLSNERRRYLLFVLFSMITIATLITIQSIVLLVSKNYEYAGILIEIYAIILIIRIMLFRGLKKKRYSANKVKKYYLISGILLIIMALLMPEFYTSLFSRKTNPALPIWIIYVQLTYALVMGVYAFRRYRFFRRKYNEYYVLYYITGVLARILSMIIAINAIVNIYHPDRYYLVIQQGTSLVFITVIFVIIIFTRRKKIVDIYDDPTEGLSHEKINVFLLEYLEIRKLLKDTIKEEDRIPFWKLKLLSNKKYIHFNAYYYDNEFIGFAFFTRDNENRFYLLYLVIKPEYQGMGYGTKILESFDLKHSSIYVSVSPDNSERIKNFYTKLGFTDSGFSLDNNGRSYSILSNKPFDKYDYVLSVRRYDSGFKPEF